MDFQQHSLPMFCGNDVEIVDAIRNKYQEVPVLSMRTEGSNDLKDIEIWYNPHTGTATVTIRPAPNTICIMLSGNTKPEVYGKPL